MSVHDILFGYMNGIVVIRDERFRDILVMLEDFIIYAEFWIL